MTIAKYIYIFSLDEASFEEELLGSTMSSIKDRPPSLLVHRIVTMYIACLRRTNSLLWISFEFEYSLFFYYTGLYTFEYPSIRFERFY